MKRSILMLGFLAAATCSVTDVVAAETTLTITDGWIRAAPPGAPMLAGYLTVHNADTTPIRVVAADSADFGAVSIHRTEIVDGVSRMRPATEVSVPAGGDLQFAPGGLHLMLMQPGRTLSAGDRIVIQLRTASGEHVDGTLEVRNAQIEARTEATPPAHQH